MDDFFNNDFKATKCTGHGQSTCKLCAFNKGVYPVHWTSMMYRVEHVSGIYCSNCVEKFRSIHSLYKLFPVSMIAITIFLRDGGIFDE